MKKYSFFKFSGASVFVAALALSAGQSFAQTIPLPDRLEIVTVEKQDIGWFKKLTWSKRSSTEAMATLYLKSVDTLEAEQQLVPAVEMQLTPGTFVSTTRGDLQVGRLHKGDFVFCREKDGEVNTLEVGLIYLSKK